MKTILLINPLENGVGKQREAYPSGALLLLGTMLKKRGHQVTIIHMGSQELSAEMVGELAASIQPHVVGITMNTFQTVSARQVAQAVKRAHSSTLVVTGGPHPSALKAELFTEFPNIDVVVYGEGEHTFMEIVEGADLQTLPGICWQGKEHPPRPQVENLDYLPLPDLSLINLNLFRGVDPVGGFPSMSISASRGCPFQCTFCNKSVWGSRVRFRKPELVVREIEWLFEESGVREFFFLDDTFNLNRAWAEEICHRLIERGLNKKVIFKTMFRANRELVDEKLLTLMRSAGFWLIFIGVESGNQAMLDSMGKGLTIEELKRAFRLTHAAGLMTIGAFIVGLPGETHRTVNDSIRLFKELEPYVTGCGAAMPFPKTEFERQVVAQGHLLARSYDEYAMGKVLVRTEALDAAQLKKEFARFQRVIIWKFVKDLIELRYWRMMLFALGSPWYITHIVRRIRASLGW